MEIYFNELSIQPNTQTVEASKEKVMELLSVMKQLRQYDINILRTFEGFYAEDLGSNYSFSSFLNDDTVKRDLKILVQSIIRNPCIPEVDSYEAEMFVNTKYDTLNHLTQYVAPEGIAISYINNVPVLSLIDFPYWQNSTLQLRIHNTNTNAPNLEDVLNISSLASLQSNEFVEWIKSITEIVGLNSYENILKIFPSEKYEFDAKAIEDIISWFYDDKRFLVRVKELIEDININPFTGGKGKTETLSGTGGRASKRIVKKDRIVYTYTSDKIHIHQCRGHYNDT
jgi:Txe/YoeB family toxin of toxin-antitoxin system